MFTKATPPPTNFLPLRGTFALRASLENWWVGGVLLGAASCELSPSADTKLPLTPPLLCFLLMSPFSAPFLRLHLVAFFLLRQPHHDLTLLTCLDYLENLLRDLPADAHYAIQNRSPRNTCHDWVPHHPRFEDKKRS